MLLCSCYSSCHARYVRFSNRWWSEDLNNATFWRHRDHLAIETESCCVTLALGIFGRTLSLLARDADVSTGPRVASRGSALRQ